MIDNLTNNSLPTAEQVNLDQYYNVLRKLDPELYLIKIALHETGLNPMIVPKIIRTIGNLAVGTGYGRVRVHMQARVVTNIVGEERSEINEDAIVD